MPAGVDLKSSVIDQKYKILIAFDNDSHLTWFKKHNIPAMAIAYV